MGSNPIRVAISPFELRHLKQLDYLANLLKLTKNASVAQSVEQGTENPCVGGSIPPRGTIIGKLICWCGSIGRAADL